MKKRIMLSLIIFVMSLFIFANKVFAYETVVTNEEILIR